MISCYNCKFGDNETTAEPCKTCLSKDVPPYFKYEPEEPKPEPRPAPKPEESITQLSIFDMMKGGKE